MIDFLYNIIIFPVVQVIEISFVIIQRVSQNYGIAIIGVSAVFTACTLPLYFIAEKWQQTERDLQKRLKPKVDKIKSAFKGDEQYMVLSTYYRQNHYHPLYAFRNSLGVLIQVPFFIAAYSYLSHLNAIQGVSFLFIKDLGSPDKFLSLGSFSLNILPILMTLINCASGVVYTKGLSTKDKFQVYGIAFVFLVLLYNSPAGLVLYWTMNNIFSLAKNVLKNVKYWKEIVYCLICFCAILVITHYVLLGFNTNRLIVSGLFSLFFFLPLFFRLFKFTQKKIFEIVNVEESILFYNSTYVLSLLILFTLCGIAIPGALIASSAAEFSFLESYTTPLPFLYTASVQAAGIFILWPLCIYFLFSKKVKYGLSLLISLLCIMALVNTFLFPLDYGDFTTVFRFSNPKNINLNSSIINGFVTLSILILFSCLLLSKKRIIFHSFQLITIGALICFSIINIYKINKDFKQHEQILAKISEESLPNISSTGNIEPVYHLSKNGKNVVIIMLDGAISGYVPYIFEEKSELLHAFSGFTYYPNCVSFGQFTTVGMPLIFGGYEYSPENIHKGGSFSREKHNESLLMMPRIFLEENYHVTVTDPSLANYSIIPDLSIFTPYPKIISKNLYGYYTNNWLLSHPELKVRSIPGLLHELLIRFSFLKSAPPVLRVFIYDRARWLKIANANETSLHTMDRYSTLDYLPQLTEVSDDTINTYTAMVNDLTHNPALFQLPDYLPAMDITNINDSLFGDDGFYHSNMASLLLLAKWFWFLQENDVYNNSRIIIVSDHGKGEDCKYKGNILLPNGDSLSKFHPLLLVKDFNSHGNLIIDTTFMTNGDVPLIAMNGLIDNPHNPFSGKIIESDKKNGILVVSSGALKPTISNNDWMYVHDNIFDPNNWKKVTK